MFYKVSELQIDMRILDRDKGGRTGSNGVLKILTILFSVLILSGCGKDGNSNGGTGNNGKSDEEADSVYGDLNSNFTYRYRYVVNGCDTCVHAFGANSESELGRMVCEILQEGPVNHGCAELPRKETFDEMCKGQEWQPTSGGERAECKTPPPEIRTPVAPDFS